MEESEKISTAFFQKIKDSLIAKTLIVDLRDNEGGANRISYKFFTLIRQFANDKKVYVLVNNGTMSQGEIFMLQLKELKNVKTLGQTTRGTIAYGSNFGKTERLGNGSIAVYLTDMRDTGGLFKYEDVGVEPEIRLSSDRDWIEQVLEIVGRQE
ncbi:S41 family peptidase [Pollutibacter soli]|uniref:S41 family peptidase n=1 Tax=Pollutibacter soli TaxID=3034157 RepID=UPI003AF8F331